MSTATGSSFVFRLPNSVVQKIDISRLVREVESLDGDLVAADVRAKSGVKTDWQPVLSEQLTDFLVLNKLQIGDSQQRTQLVAAMRKLKDSVPVIHMTFASNADQESLKSIVEWLRSSVHLQAVIAIGLQPDLVGGVHVRTSNRAHDLSIRAKLKASRGLIRREVEALSAGR